jgi:hypothetical protein
MSAASGVSLAILGIGLRPCDEEIGRRAAGCLVHGHHEAEPAILLASVVKAFRSARVRRHGEHLLYQVGRDCVALKLG